eukprot:752421-Rhodomonas_salina.2
MKETSRLRALVLLALALGSTTRAVARGDSASVPSGNTSCMRPSSGTVCVVINETVMSLRDAAIEFENSSESTCSGPGSV